MLSWYHSPMIFVHISLLVEHKILWVKFRAKPGTCIPEPLIAVVLVCYSILFFQFFSICSSALPCLIYMRFIINTLDYLYLGTLCLAQLVLSLINFLNLVIQYLVLYTLGTVSKYRQGRKREVEKKREGRDERGQATVSYQRGTVQPRSVAHHTGELSGERPAAESIPLPGVLRDTVYIANRLPLEGCTRGIRIVASGI